MYCVVLPVLSSSFSFIDIIRFTSGSHKLQQCIHLIYAPKLIKVIQLAYDLSHTHYLLIFMCVCIVCNCHCLATFLYNIIQARGDSVGDHEARILN